MSVTGYSKSYMDSNFATIGTPTGFPGIVALDSFSGSTDDAKLTNFWTLATGMIAASEQPPALVLANRSHTFNTARTSFSGLRILGPGGFASNAEKSSSYQPCVVHITTSGVWLTITGGDAWNTFIGNGIAFTGTTTTTFMADSGDGSVWHCGHIRDVSFNSFLNVLGTLSNPLHCVASIIDGWWESNGSLSVTCNLAGSDNRFWTNGGLFDSAAGNAPSGASVYHLWCNYLDYTTIGPIYITAEAGWGGLRVSGSSYNANDPSNTSIVTVSGAVVMGRNQSAPSNGSLVRVEGGMLKLRDSIVPFGMANASSAGHSDGGVINVSGGGALLVDGCTYDRYTGQAESVPFLYTTSSGPVRASNTFLTGRGGAWTGLPQVHNAGSGSLTADSTMTVV